MIVCSSFRVSWFHLRAFLWLLAVMMQNVTSFIQKVALHSRIHDRNFLFCKKALAMRLLATPRSLRILTLLAL